MEIVERWRKRKKKWRGGMLEISGDKEDDGECGDEVEMTFPLNVNKTKRQTEIKGKKRKVKSVERWRRRRKKWRGGMLEVSGWKERKEWR